MAVQHQQRQQLDCRQWQQLHAGGRKLRRKCDQGSPDRLGGESEQHGKRCGNHRRQRGSGCPDDKHFQIVNDTGTLGDFITSDGTVDVSGQYSGGLLAGETIQVSANGGSTWLDADPSSPFWSASGLALVPGSGTLTTRTIDTAGNVTPGASHSYVYSTLPLFTGTPSVNTLTGTNDDEEFYGLASADTIYAHGGNDFLDGGSGNDTMYGGQGDDTYVVDSSGDVIVELLDEGTDAVRSTASSYTLPAEVENLTLVGTSNQNGTGNTLNNVITGNSLNNTLNGDLGNDTLIGGDGNDNCWDAKITTACWAGTVTIR